MWKPELQPNVRASDETRLEWLVRSFRRLSQWSGTVFQAGYGGIYRETPIAWVGSLSTSWLVIGGYAYDTELTPNPVGVVQDAANGTIGVTDAGLWQLSISLTADITPVTANASNTVELSLYNVTDSVVFDQPSIYTVPRYGEAINFSLSVPVSVAVDAIGKVFALAIRVRNATPTITITDLTAIDFHLTRVAGTEAL